MKQLLLILGTITILSSCSNKPADEQSKEPQKPSRDEYVANIKKLESEMFKATEIDNAAANLAIEAYTEFVAFFPEDTLAPDYLFKAGEVATASKKYHRALEYYEAITGKYPNYKHVVESLYLQGFLNDNFLNDDKAAKTIYEQVIAKYPNTNSAKDAASAMALLGKTDEQIIEEFKKKNKKAK